LVMLEVAVPAAYRHFVEIARAPLFHKAGDFDAFGQQLAVALVVDALFFIVLEGLQRLWRDGYAMYMKCAGRANMTISSQEVMMEVFYFLGDYTAGMTQKFLCLRVFQALLGMQLPTIAVGCVLMELSLIPMTLETFKFVPMHSLHHEVPEFNFVSHYEHHVCKGIYPSTSAAGNWEPILLGGDAGTFGLPVLMASPTLALTCYLTVNLMVHTMLPLKRLLHYHVYHHLLTVDIYGGADPSSADDEFSKFLKSDECPSVELAKGWSIDSGRKLRKFKYVLFSAPCFACAVALQVFARHVLSVGGQHLKSWTWA